MKLRIPTSILGLATIAFASCSSEKSVETVQEDPIVLEETKTPSLTLLWETPATLETVESVLFDSQSGKIYTSNIIGQNPTEKDGKGSISIIDTEGNIVTQDFVTGLNAPKGMGIANGKLYVTDIDELVEIDLESGKITQKYPIDGGQFLNDIATEDDKVFFTDMNTGTVYILMDGEISKVSEGNESINGLEVSAEGVLYGLDASGLKKINEDGSSEVLNDVVTGGDGLISLGDGKFVASRWAGEIYFVDQNGETLLLDTKAEESNTADIGYNPSTKVVYVPTFFKNKVAAYQLEY